MTKETLKAVNDMNERARNKPVYRKLNNTSRETLADFILDAAAFIRARPYYSKKADLETFATLIHDILGLADEERCFLPRVSGYADREASK